MSKQKALKNSKKCISPQASLQNAIASIKIEHLPEVHRVARLYSKDLTSAACRYIILVGLFTCPFDGKQRGSGKNGKDLKVLRFM